MARKPINIKPSEEGSLTRIAKRGGGLSHPAGRVLHQQQGWHLETIDGIAVERPRLGNGDGFHWGRFAAGEEKRPYAWPAATTIATRQLNSPRRRGRKLQRMVTA